MVARTFGTNIAEQSSTLGVATYQLDGPLMGFRAFADDFINGDTPYYAVKNADESKYEYNKGVTTFTNATPDTLARAPWLSSNTNAAVSWAAEDLPLIIYIPTAAELFEFMVKSWLDTARNAAITFGKWWKTNGVSAGIHQLNMYDGTTDIPIAEVNTTTHKYHGYGTSKYTRTQSSTFRQLSASTLLPFDNTIPQNNEGIALSDYDVTVNIESATSTIVVRALIDMDFDNSAAHIAGAVFIDSVANAVATGHTTTANTGYSQQLQINMTIPNPGIGSHTYKIRVGYNGTTGSFSFNGNQGVAYFGGVLASFLEIEERF